MCELSLEIRSLRHERRFVVMRIVYLRIWLHFVRTVPARDSQLSAINGGACESDLRIAADKNGAVRIFTEAVQKCGRSQRPQRPGPASTISGHFLRITHVPGGFRDGNRAGATRHSGPDLDDVDCVRNIFKDCAFKRVACSHQLHVT